MAVRLEFNSDGFRELLNSPEVEQLVLEHAQQIAERANSASGLDSFEAHSLKRY